MVVKTGCAVTWCRVLSYAFCRNPDDEKGARLLLEEDHFGKNQMRKFSGRSCGGKMGRQMPRGGRAWLIFVGLHESERFLQSKKADKRYKRLKYC